MTASSVEEIPRGMEFLFSLNRINVAVSRAKGLAPVFAAPRLRAAKCDTVEQMRLVNTLSALPEFGGISMWEAFEPRLAENDRESPAPLRGTLFAVIRRRSDAHTSELQSPMSNTSP